MRRPLSTGTLPRGRRGREGVRPYRRADDDGLLDVCLRTADAGEDATSAFRHPGLPGSVYALPYVRFEPDLCTVLDDGTRPGGVGGYVLGTSDTVAFEQWCERAWWPALRRRHPVDDQVRATEDHRLAGLVADGVRTDAQVAERYPAHLHVDLLPHVQGHGWGRRLVEAFVEDAAAAGAVGVHLGVSPRNERAVGFYRRLGFEDLQVSDGALLLGRSLV